VLDGHEYHGATRRLEPGQSLCLVTDGVTEAQNLAGELYGGWRLRQVLQRRVPGASSARALLEAVRADVAEFAGPAEAADDVTVLVLRWNGPARDPGAAPAGT
jgi:serine phosphatase RsbU (regulator of sigma subunit)